MLYIAKFYNQMHILIMALIIVVIAIIVLKASIMHEERLCPRNFIPRVLIINNMIDPMVRIKELVLVPGTNFLYTPVYLYYKDGVERTTISYIKCKWETR